MSELKRSSSGDCRVVVFFSLLSSYAIDREKNIHELVVRFRPTDFKIKLFSKAKKPWFRYLPVLDALGVVLYPFAIITAVLSIVALVLFQSFFGGFVRLSDELWGTSDDLDKMIAVWNFLLYIAGLVHIFLFYWYL